jgi:branched-chain amino acid transport system ATP-binding protein
MLEIEGLCAGYGDVQILHGVSLSVKQGEVVSLVGANGAGKTTTLRAVSGIVAIREGDIRFDGQSLRRLKPAEIVRLGIAHVPEGRELFPYMSVEENLQMGANQMVGSADVAKRVEDAYVVFPKLRERRAQRANTLSGGEQQMLTIGRGLMLQPRLLILDEPSLGLSPIMVASILKTIVEVSGRGVSVLLVEQNLRQSLKHSNRGYVMENGEIVLGGEAATLLDDPRTGRAVLGLGIE